MQATEAETIANKRLQKAKLSHNARIASVEQALETQKLYALAIETNLDLIDSIIATVRSFVGSGMVNMTYLRTGAI
jgi:hypothetical protein